MGLPADLLTRSTAEGARLVALVLLDQAVAAVGRLDDRDDPDALHDFRVALRRLRTTLKAYREARRATTKRERRRLRDLARRSNTGRDAEVQLLWLRKEGTRLRGSGRQALRWLSKRAEERRDAEYAGAIAGLRAEFLVLERKVRRGLSRYRMRLENGAAAMPFGAAAGTALEGAATDFKAALAEVRSPGDETSAHAARLAAKRLRYLLEPLTPWISDGRDLVRRLKTMQDHLGELHDCHVLEAELAKAVAELGADQARRLHEAAVASGDPAARRAARSDPDLRPGVSAIGRLVRVRRDALFSRLERKWLQGHGAGFVAALEGAAAALAAPAAVRPPSRGRSRAWRRDARAPYGRRRGQDV